ncbi:MAG: aspartate 1-decarboxylase [Chitinophagaceae bacterium]|nr:aspartate 1-decarboxylase [Chitinophagaceae bacterium]
MLMQLLRVKIQQLTVTESSAGYPGSIGLPPELMKASGLRLFELVHVNNLTNGNRILTYAVPSKQETSVTLNGAASKHCIAGDLIHIIAFGYYTQEEAETHRPLIVHTDAQNRLLECKTYSFQHAER